MTIEIRPAEQSDLASLERRCWRGGEDEMRDRIASQGTCSMIVTDGGRPVGQLYIRAFRAGFRSPAGLHDGSWWADLSAIDEELQLPGRTAMLGCWHVGRVRDPDGTEREAEHYRGRGIGVRLLRGAVEWLESGEAPFDALAAKATDSEDRAYIGWLGGLPLSVFEAEGFRRVLTFEEPAIIDEPDAVPAEAIAEHPARFHLAVLEQGS